MATAKRIHTIAILLHSKYASYRKTFRVLLRSSTLYTHHNTGLHGPVRYWGVAEFIEASRTFRRTRVSSNTTVLTTQVSGGRYTKADDTF